MTMIMVPLHNNAFRNRREIVLYFISVINK